MNEISQFEVPCSYRSGGMYCSSGHIYVMEPGGEIAVLAKMEDGPVRCLRCEGVGYILTPMGKQLIEMMWRHMERRVADLVEEIKPME
jgi:hypothetical protein